MKLFDTGYLLEVRYFRTDKKTSNRVFSSRSTVQTYTNNTSTVWREEMNKRKLYYKKKKKPWMKYYLLYRFLSLENLSLGEISVRVSEWKVKQFVSRAPSALRVVRTRSSPPRANAETWARDAKQIHQVSVTAHPKHRLLRPRRSNAASGGEKLTWLCFMSPHSSKSAREMSELWCKAHISL